MLNGGRFSYGDHRSCADNINEMATWLAGVLYAWGKYRVISALYLTPDNQVLLQIFHHNIHILLQTLGSYPRKMHTSFMQLANRWI